jgi:hypothetical protein
MVEGMPSWADPANLVVVRPVEVRLTAATALELLQAVYRDPDLPLSTRMRAAALALPHESPRLTAIANVDVSDFSEKLEKAILRTAAAYLPDKTQR